MPDTDSITLVKRFTYRDQPEEWSNTYHLDGTTPTSDAEWKTLATAIWTSEKTLVAATSVLVRAYGYVAGNEHSVSQIDYSVGTPLLPAGTLVTTAGNKVAGDQAAWIRARVGTSSTGKKVYVRKYFHDVVVSSPDPEELLATWQTAAVAHATLMLAGSLPGGMKWVGPQGATAVEPSASRYITTRTLKRRGKRP